MPSSTASPSPSVSSVALPDSALGLQAQWVLAVLHGEVDDVAAEAEDRLTDAMLAELSAEDFAATLAPLAQTAPWSVTAVQGAGDQAVVTVEDSAGDALDMQIAVDGDGLIAGLLFLPAAGDREPAASWTELEENVEGFAADTSLTVVEIVDGTMTPLAAAGGVDDPKPSGSMFKLYVLGAVVDAIAAGDLAWDDRLIVTDDVKSLPSGELQDVAPGTEVDVREAAEKMIAISDNTATDLLVAAVGAERVEAAFAAMGVDDDARNIPLLTTRALFQLGWGDGGSGGEARTSWNAAVEGDDLEGQRDVLDDLPRGVLDIPVEDVATPVWQDGLDWFFTAEELVRAHLWLDEASDTEAGAPLRDILSANSGLGEVGEDWAHVAFKGGSSIGVLGGSWLLERADGRMFAVTIQGASADPSQLLDQRTFFAQVSDAVALLEAE